MTDPIEALARKMLAALGQRERWPVSWEDCTESRPNICRDFLILARVALESLAPCRFVSNFPEAPEADEPECVVVEGSR